MVGGIGHGATPQMAFIPCRASVKRSLGTALTNTISRMQATNSDPVLYDFTGSYPNGVCLYLPLAEHYMEKARLLGGVQNLDDMDRVPAQLPGISFYLGIFKDGLNRRLTAVKRVSQFG